MRFHKTMSCSFSDLIVSLKEIQTLIKIGIFGDKTDAERMNFSFRHSFVPVILRNAGRPKSGLR